MAISGEYERENVDTNTTNTRTPYDAGKKAIYSDTQNAVKEVNRNNFNKSLQWAVTSISNVSRLHLKFAPKGRLFSHRIKSDN